MNELGPNANTEPFSLKQIRAFLAVAELRHITTAAEQLHMSHSGLSRVVSSLEAAVGERLFVRTPSGLSLSATGTAFLPYADKLQRRYIDLLAAARVDADPSKGWTVACTELVLPMFLPALMQSTGSGGAGDTRWRVAGMKSAQVVERVESGRADFGLCMNIGATDAMPYITLLKAPLGLLAAPHMRLPDEISTLAVLNAIPMARLSEYNMLPSLLADQAHELDGYFNAPIAMDTLDSMFTVVRAGRVAAIASAIAASLPSAAGLRFIPLPTLLPQIELRLVARSLENDPFTGSGPARQIKNAVHSLSLNDAVERVTDHQMR